MVNYPHQISRKIAQVRPKKSNRVDFANRGMSFESAINATNDYYLSRGLAVIHKKTHSCSNCQSRLSQTLTSKDCGSLL